MITKTFTYQNSKISYKILGEGDPVIMLHGFGFNNSIWIKIAETLKDQYRFIMPDLAGSGESEKLIKGNATLADHALVIKGLIDHEKINNPVIIGHSMGGYILMAFEKILPTLSKGIVLFHSSVYGDDDGKISARNKSIEFIEKYGTETFFNNSLPSLFYNKEKSSSEINKYLNEAKKIEAGIIIDYYKAMIKREDNRETLKNLKKPVQFIIGEFDTAVPFKTSLQQTFIANISDVNILRESGHIGMLEEPETSSEIIQRFLNQACVK